MRDCARNFGLLALEACRTVGWLAAFAWLLLRIGLKRLLIWGARTIAWTARWITRRLEQLSAWLVSVQARIDAALAARAARRRKAAARDFLRRRALNKVPLRRRETNTAAGPAGPRQRKAVIRFAAMGHHRPGQ
jgi:hypothetical protein